MENLTSRKGQGHSMYVRAGSYNLTVHMYNSNSFFGVVES